MLGRSSKCKKEPILQSIIEREFKFSDCSLLNESSKALLDKCKFRREWITFRYSKMSELPSMERDSSFVCFEMQ